MNPEIEKPKTETESETDTFECPPLPSDLQVRHDQLLAQHRGALASNPEYSGELLHEAESLAWSWRESCENEWRSAHNDQGKAQPRASLTLPKVREREQGSGNQPPSGAASQPEATKLSEYLSLKARERKNEVSAGTAFSFWRQNQAAIARDARELDSDSAYTEILTAGGALIRKLKK